jgi:hypothetical protein
MPEKHRAVEVIPNKLWITYGKTGDKTGTMKLDLTKGCYDHYFSNGQDMKSYLIAEINQLFNFEERAEPSSWNQQHVFGYPIIDTDTFKTKERDNLPCFTKTLESKIYFAAGYYGINFDNGGWLDSFCPKLSTLRKYEFIGPFRTEIDVSIAIRRKKRAYD